ncbi:MAG: hypothetical protein ACFFAS_11665 [Promethearchaeota archaeon]
MDKLKALSWHEIPRLDERSRHFLLLFQVIPRRVKNYIAFSS